MMMGDGLPVTEHWSCNSPPWCTVVMEGDVETIWALLKGDIGMECKTVEALPLSEGKEEVALVLFIMTDETLVIFVDPVEDGEKEEGFSLLMLAKCVGGAATILLILAGELVELRW